MNTASDHWREYWHHDGTLPRAIVALILVVFAQTLWFDFVFWDDNVYVYSNPDIRYVTVGGIKRAFTSLVTSHWHPVTTLFHMADAALFGMNPGADHAVNGQFGR